MNTVAAANQNTNGKLSLLDAVIIILTSCSILIFVFTIGAKFLGKETFDRLPDFIKDSYSAIWSAGVVAGGALVGSVVDTLSKQASTKANFMVYIMATTLLIMALIVGTVEFSRSMEGPQFTVPNGAKALDTKAESTHPVVFYLQNKLFGGNPVRITGTYVIKDGQISGNVTSAELEPGAPGTPLPAIHLTSISIQVCYLAVRNGAPTYTAVPEFSTPTNSEKIATMANIATPYQIPNFSFSVNVKNIDNIAPPYLCAYIDGEFNAHLTIY